ncbi:MAG: glycerate kinase [Bacteroidales bacterium]|nr:glycerate kinase [Clostridium sp.]MCM1203735.1 glycerate kinase [Bacteroidales bacterium]
MKIIVAMDSFKGSMTSLEAGKAAREGILRAMPDAEVIVKLLADGGEGTMEALVEGLGGKKITLSVTNPVGEPVLCSYSILQDGRTAVMEMAQAAGLTLVPEEKREPLRASTYGVGEMIVDAVHRGCRHFIMGIGGSATNDGGIGMLQALGYRFMDAKGQAAGAGAGALSGITEIRADKVLPELGECDFQIACDVANPLCGENGATLIYGPQKGLSMELCREVDKAMEHYAEVAEAFSGKSGKAVPGTGAAGGLGFAFITFLNGELVPGAELVFRAACLEQALKTAQFLVTGEGRLDAQTMMGKAPARAAKLAKRYGVKVLAFAGEVTGDAGKCNGAGIDAFFSIAKGAVSLQRAMEPETAKRNLADTVEQVFRLIEELRRD